MSYGETGNILENLSMACIVSLHARCIYDVIIDIFSRALLKVNEKKKEEKTKTNSVKLKASDIPNTARLCQIYRVFSHINLASSFFPLNNYVF